MKKLITTSLFIATLTYIVVTSTFLALLATFGDNKLCQSFCIILIIVHIVHLVTKKDAGIYSILPYEITMAVATCLAWSRNEKTVAILFSVNILELFIANILQKNINM